MKNSPCEQLVISRMSGCPQHRRAPRRASTINAPRLPGKTPDHYFAAIIQSCDDAIISKTTNGIVTSWNRGAENLFGYSEKEMIGHPLLRLFPLDRLDEEYYIDERIFAGESVPSYDTVRIRKDGTPVDISVTMSPVRDDEGHIVGVCKMARDNADLRRQQERQQQDAQFDACRDVADKSRHTNVRRMAEALHNDELILHYQPKINMKTGAVVGVEALIRWLHPERGTLLPGQFLPLIEGHSLNEEIGIWVVGCALRQMEAWRLAGLHLPVSVNLASNQLQNEDFPAILAGLLARYPELDPGDLELEILETSALQDINAASRVMGLCRELGVQFSIDDFGTGYSSLTYLKRLPACTLKIDQSLVRDMLNDHEDLAIVRGVIGLARAFRRKVIAEGVETMEHGKMLLQMGCELAQGYGVSRPMSAEHVLDWMLRWNACAAWQ